MVDAMIAAMGDAVVDVHIMVDVTVYDAMVVAIVDVMVYDAMVGAMVDEIVEKSRTAPGARFEDGPNNTGAATIGAH